MKSVLPGQVNGTLWAPPSKSMAQRAIAVASLIRGTSRIYMGTPCDDIESAMASATAVGALVESVDGGITVTGGALPKQENVDCGEAGLCLRMFSAIAALFDSPSRLVARGTLAVRPVEMVVGPLVALGARCATNDGLPPLHIQGPIAGGTVEVDGTTSSQFLTGLLIALTHCSENSQVLAPGLKSKPYVEMTLELLRGLGAKIETSEDLEQFSITGGLEYSPFNYRVPGDWSGASFPLVAGAIAGRVEIKGLDTASSQADIKIMDALGSAGAQITVQGEAVSVAHAPLTGFEFDATHCPDLFPPLVSLAANCRGISKIKGVHRLASKESDRAVVLMEEFGKMGLSISVAGDHMVITGGKTSGATVFSHGDHRIAMATGVAALCGDGTVNIEGDDSVAKSYPDFFKDIESIGANVK